MDQSHELGSRTGSVGVLPDEGNVTFALILPLTGDAAGLVANMTVSISPAAHPPNTSGRYTQCG